MIVLYGKTKIVIRVQLIFYLLITNLGYEVRTTTLKMGLYVNNY